MIEVKTASGFTCEVDPEKLDDWDFMNAVIDSEGEDTGKALKAQMYICKFMLGEDGEKRLKDHLKEKHGRVPYTVMMREIGEIFLLLKTQTKK